MSAKVVAQKRACGHVGDFYNHLGAGIIGGEVTGNVYDSSAPAFGDVYNPKLKISLEAKGSNNGHGWRMSKNQMESYKNNGWKYVYLFGGYVDDDPNNKHRNRLSKLKTRRDQFDFLAERTNQVFIIDLEFVKLLEILGVGKLYPNGAFGKDRNEGADYELRRRRLWRFITPSSGYLSELGIDSADWRFRTFPEYVKRYVIQPKKRTAHDLNGARFSVSTQFSLHTILSPRVDRLLAKEIKGNDDYGLPF
jgi:hypothetical protein